MLETKLLTGVIHHNCNYADGAKELKKLSNRGNVYMSGGVDGGHPTSELSALEGDTQTAVLKGHPNASSYSSFAKSDFQAPKDLKRAKSIRNQQNY